jgi:hypothetical protein
MLNNLLERQVSRSIDVLRFYDELRIWKVDWEVPVCRTAQTAENEKGSTKCRQQQNDSIPLHIAHVAV